MGRIDNAIDEGTHFLARNASMAVGKGGLLFVNGGHAITQGAHGLLHSVNSTVGSIGLGGALGGLGPAGLIFMGGISAVSAVVGQMDYNHNLGRVRKTYAEEIAAALGKYPEEVTNQDLLLMAKGDDRRGIEPNKVIAQEIAKQKTERNIGIALSAGLTLGVFAVLGIAAATFVTAGVATGPVGLLAAGLTNIGLTGTIGGASIAHVAAHTAIGIAMYNVLKHPLHKLSEKVFGVHQDSPHEHIEQIANNLKRGKEITREQVLEVYVAAHKELDAQITERYGKKFHSMKDELKAQVADDLARQMNLDKVARDLTNKEYPPAELAFLVQGDVSGHSVSHDMVKEHHKGAHTRAIEHMRRKALSNDEMPLQDSALTSAAAGMNSEETKQGLEKRNEDSWHPAQEQNGKPSFAERFAAKKGQKAGHVEQLEQSRSEDRSLTSQQLA